jgi:hypothetical protein
MICWDRQILPRYPPLRWAIENLFMIGKERPPACWVNRGDQADGEVVWS